MRKNKINNENESGKAAQRENMQKPVYIPANYYTGETPYQKQRHYKKAHPIRTAFVNLLSTLGIMFLSFLVVFFMTPFGIIGAIHIRNNRRHADVEVLAKDYIEQKYGYAPKVEKSRSELSPFPEWGDQPTDNVWVSFTDGTVVFYDVENGGVFYDNKQSGEITYALYDEIFPEVFKCMPELETSFKAVFCNRQIDAPDISFFHEYYDGDIKSYLNKEDIFVNADFDIVFDEENYQEKFETFENEIYKNIFLKRLRGQRALGDIDVYALKLNENDESKKTNIAVLIICNDDVRYLQLNDWNNGLDDIKN